MFDVVAAVRAWECGDLPTLVTGLSDWRHQDPDRFGDIVAQLLMAIAAQGGSGSVESLVQGLLAGDAMTPDDWQACLTGLAGQDILPATALACLTAGVGVAAAYASVITSLLALDRAPDAAILAAQAMVQNHVPPAALRPAWQSFATASLINEMETLLPPRTESDCLRFVALLDGIGADEAADAWLAEQLIGQYRCNRALLVALVQRRTTQAVVAPSLVTALNQIVAADGDNLLAVRVLVEKLGQLGRYGEAIAHVETALLRHSDDAHLWFALGYLLSFRRHDDAETTHAIQAFERARELGLDDGPTRTNLCLLYREAGREAECWALLRSLAANRALSYWPRFSPWPAPTTA